MTGLTAKTRLTFGLVCLLISVLLGAMVLGIVPDRDSAVLDGRARLCETIAVFSTVLVSERDHARLRAALEAAAGRNDDLLSAAVRRADGRLTLEIGDHTAHWDVDSLAAQRSTDTHVHVPVWDGDQRWGAVELRFRPVGNWDWIRPFRNPWVRIVLFVASASFLAFVFYLGRMLKHLDPSKAVPRRVRSALDTLAEGLVILDRKERVLLANQAFADWFGRSPDEMLGMQISKLLWRTPEEDAGELPWLMAMNEQRPQINVPLNLDSDDSIQRSFLVNAAPVMDQGGNYRGVMVSFDDVTELESQKVALRESKNAAVAASAAKSAFLANMSHEIRTPMNAILGFTEVLRRGFEEDERERQEYLGTIHSSGQHLLDLINDILDLSKIESGRLEIELRPCSPAKVVAEVIAILRGRAEEKGLGLSWSADGGLPETIQTDAVRFRQILTNLVGNAIRFTDHGSVHVAVWLLPHDEKPQLALDVIDTGIGVSPEALQRVFEPFSQADNSITRRFGGTGLGLSISRQFAEALGGRISVESEPGRGSTFTVTIDTGPLEGVRICEPTSEAIAATASVPPHETDMQLPPAKILVVDDGPSNRKLLRLVLSRAGVDVTTADNGQVAVRLATDNPFDAVLMDMQMPVMDGYHATRELRRRGFAAPIIALTAHAMNGDEQQCRAAGCTGFLTKPLDIDRLLEVLAAILAPLGRSKPAAARSAASPSAPRQVDSGEIHSTLPTDDPEFCEIIHEFVELLHEELGQIKAAWRTRDFKQIARLAHNIKGAGGSAGFAELMPPAKRLELLAKAGQEEQFEAAIAQLQAVASRIALPPLSVASVG